MLSLSNLTIAIEQHILAKDFAVTILPGAVVNFYGDNGVGKTSLLRTIAGLRAKHDGEIYVAETHQELCYVAHQNAVQENMTVAENLEFFAKINDTSLALGAAYKYFSLEELRHKKCRALSAGQQRLVALARLSLSSAKIWLLDEPFSNLDEHNRKKLEQLLTAKTADLGIIIMTAHSKLNFADIVNINLSDWQD